MYKELIYLPVVQVPTTTVFTGTTSTVLTSTVPVHPPREGLGTSAIAAIVGESNDNL